MVTKQRTRIVYDFKKESKGVHGDEEGTQIGESAIGKFPNCLPPEWEKTFPDGGETINYIKRSCNCGNHTYYWARLPNEAWPDECEERIRVVEK